MKRIIEGVTYNTETATIVAKWEYREFGDDYDTNATLYQTRGGAFFVVHEWTDEKPQVYFAPISRDGVLKLIEKTNNLEILNEEVLQPPPEAVEETAPAATLYIRIPASLKEKIDAAAKEEELSVNSWSMRCIEKCCRLEEVGGMLAAIVQTALIAESSELGELSMQSLHKIISHMKGIAEDAAGVFGWRGEQFESMQVNAPFKYDLQVPHFDNDGNRWPIQQS